MESDQIMDAILKQQEEKFNKNIQNHKKKAKVERTQTKFDSANHELQKHRGKTHN